MRKYLCTLGMLLAIVLHGLLLSCNDDKDIVPSSTNRISPPATLLHTWKCTGYGREGNPTTIQYPGANTCFTITFLNDSIFEGVGSVNTFGGHYSHEGQALSFKDLISTKINAPDKYEPAFYHALQNVTSYIITDPDHLKLFYSKDEYMNFESFRGYRYKDGFIRLLPKNNSSLCYVQARHIQNPLTREQVREILEKEGAESISENGEGFLFTSNKVPQDERLFVSQPFCIENEPSSTLFVLPDIAVQLKSGITEEQLTEKYADVLYEKQEERSTYAPLYCNTPFATPEEVLDFNNKLYSDDIIDWCEPNLLGQIYFDSRK